LSFEPTLYYLLFTLTADTIPFAQLHVRENRKQTSECIKR